MSGVFGCARVWLVDRKGGAQNRVVHDINLITTVAFGLVAALIFGLLAKRIGLSPIVGYMIAGIVLGPYRPGFVRDVVLGK